MRALFLDLCQFAVICSTTKMYIVTIKKMKRAEIYWKIFNSYHHIRSICRTMPSSIHFYYVNLFSPLLARSRLDNFNQFPFKYQSKIYHSRENWTEQKGEREWVRENLIIFCDYCDDDDDDGNGGEQFISFYVAHTIHTFHLYMGVSLSPSNHQYLFQPFLLVYLVMMMWL